jgi:hypothetical protein
MAAQQNGIGTFCGKFESALTPVTKLNECIFSKNKTRNGNIMTGRGKFGFYNAVHDLG